MNGTLSRYCHGKFGTFSTLQMGDLVLDMVEQDWENNKPYVSCIPNGTYTLEYYISPKHGPSYILSNPELNIGKFKGEATRFGCLIHKANLASQLEGCMAPGMLLGFYKNQWSVSKSGDAMDELIKVLGKVKTHKLIITGDFPLFKET